MDKVSLQELADRLRQSYGAQRIWPFGFHARGAAGEDSDLDLLIVSPASEGFFRRMATVRRLLRGSRYGSAVSPIALTPHELEARIERGDQFIGEIVSQGIEL